MPRAKPDRGKRTTTSDATRTRILDAARELCVEQGFSRFTMDGVAERAGVSRLTVYYQFGSKADLLEALLDHVAGRGRIDRLPEAFREADPLVGLSRFIEVFCGFWASDPVAIQRIRGWAMIEPELEAVLARDAWQWKGLDVLVRRIAKQHGKPTPEEVPGLVDVLHALLSPESYEKLAAGKRGPDEVARLLDGAARRLLGF